MLKKSLESRLASRNINQSVLKEINPEYSLEGLMLKLKLQYFGYLMPRANSFEKMGKIEGRRRRGQQRLDGIQQRLDGWKASNKGWMVGRYHRFNGCESEQTVGDSEGLGSLVCCSPRGHKELDMTERLHLHLF